MEKEILLGSILNSVKNLETQEIKHLYGLSRLAGEIRKDELARIPLHINVIMIAAKGKLKETAHSEILQHLLKHQEILDSFVVNILGIKNKGLSVDDVRPAEKDRIDVSIYSDKLCVIIENKVNDAGEQTGQIFRYVQLAKEGGYRDEEIIVLYLNSSHWDKPSDKSLTNEGKGIERIPEIIENNLIIRDYAHDIYKWVKNLSLTLSPKEEYINSALHQYIDYLEEYFYLTDKFTAMKEKINSIIDSEILVGLSDANDVNYEKRINTLTDAKEDLELLKTGIENRITELTRLKKIYLIEQELANKGLKLSEMSLYGYDKNDSGVKIELNGKKGFIAYGNDYIGFAFNTPSLNESEISFLNELFNQYGKVNAGEETKWPVWAYVNETDILIEFVNFVSFVKGIAEQEDNNSTAITFI